MEAELERVEFRPFDKIPRLNRGMVITEKIDGTNACVVVKPTATTVTNPQNPADPFWNLPIARAEHEGEEFGLYAQSRKRMITPGKSTDNAGFAGWVVEHADELVRLGVGRHYGEWWGSGIQRNYGLTEKRFSLFNVGRWEKDEFPDCCSLVPVVKRYDFSAEIIERCLDYLRENGSMAAPGFMDAEGIVIYLTAARSMFKVTLENDEKPKNA